ncbi:dihydrolipoamide acetyltransferase family protein [Sphingorhabdus sp.]|jgi:2-oxoisovalerate dehydrogenase E2 component (dihydrolipoyl transacylase)|uniref:dihydrolipoamide acetyltransferase family protein n=1 Tax=Sphingorhabdus sp. TaxID=1902408 RepID=UPI0037CAF6A9
MPKFTFNLPDIGEGIAEAEIVAWHVQVGDKVTEDQPLADMMTDKATVEMESPVSGVVTKVAGDAGDVIAIGAMLVEIEVAGDVSKKTATETATETISIEPILTVVEDDKPHPLEPIAMAEVTPPLIAPPPVAPVVPHAVPASDKVTASPAVRQRAKDLGVDLADVKAAGGHVRHADLDAYLTYGSQLGYRPAHMNARRADEAIKVIGMRRRIADNMAASKRHIPHFTYVEEIDVTAIEAMRADLNANRGAKPKLTLLPMLIVAICKTIPQFPMINARFDDEAGVVTRHGAVHLGMATQTNAGLMVPVIRDAQDLNIWQLATEIARLAEAARSGAAKSEELSGSTLTITSLGPLGGIVTTPVINRPEVAIIGPNKIVERPMFVGDTIEARKLMNLSISCDHRVVDGWDAASYVQALKKLIETPVLLFAD